jgi:hypothetical protein
MGRSPASGPVRLSFGPSEHATSKFFIEIDVTGFGAARNGREHCGISRRAS